MEWETERSYDFLHGSCTRVEMGTDIATRVPFTHYPMGTRVLVTVNLVWLILQGCQPVRSSYIA